MKNTLLSIIFLFIVSFSVDAQWYNRSCGVTDISNWTPDEFECMWRNASRCVVGGAITTGIGISCFIAGGIIWYNYGTLGGSSPSITISGLGLFAIVPIGITIWITGAVRKSQLRNTPHSKGINSHSLNIAPTINRNHFNNSYSLCLTASLRF
jgi:hypothetical protein